MTFRVRYLGVGVGCPFQLALWGGGGVGVGDCLGGARTVQALGAALNFRKIALRVLWKVGWCGEVRDQVVQCLCGCDVGLD